MTPLTIIDRGDVLVATSGVSGNSQQCVESETIAYSKFLEALHADDVCIANRAPPYVPASGHGSY